MSAVQSSPWIPAGLPRAKDARPRLLCVHYSGKGASMFRDWPARLGDAAEVAAIQLPGREDRLRDKPIADIDTLLAELVPAVKPWVDAPFVLFGHCMGALLAAELAVALRRHCGVQPHALVLSSVIPSWQEKGSYDLSHLGDAALIRELRQRGSLTPKMLAEPALLTFILPSTRADSALCESIRAKGRPESPALDCPLALYAGRTDSRFEPEALRAWEAMSTGPARLTVFEGDHGFLDANPDAVIDAVRAELPGGGCP
ncbi:alpha/beta fold hydrolase [Pendulispora rubella]|uniref:Alpha/beta fold hydrolase n=1 Tax=Pendulispora rubella TaxID=2741070 RepID=A0ABZ2LDT2_9BACT